MKAALFSLMMVLLAPVPAIAQEAAPTEVKVVKVKKVCRSVAVTGRRIASSVCHTPEQWAEFDKRNAEDAKNYINNISDMGSRGPGSAVPTAAIPGISGN